MKGKVFFILIKKESLWKPRYLYIMNFKTADEVIHIHDNLAARKQESKSFNILLWWNYKHTRTHTKKQSKRDFKEFSWITLLVPILFFQPNTKKFAMESTLKVKLFHAAS